MHTAVLFYARYNILQIFYFLQELQYVMAAKFKCFTYRTLCTM